MPRINQVNKDKASPKVKELLHQVELKLGKTPNIFLHMAHSEPVLKGYMDLSEAANHTSLSPRLREEIALIVAQANHCQYCLSAHTAIAKALGLQESEITQARECQVRDPKSQAILHFAKTVVEKKGSVGDQCVTELKAAGVTEKELTEIMLVLALNMFTNYFNHVIDPKIDFPVATELHYTHK